jgi:hypothetical protein
MRAKNTNLIFALINLMAVVVVFTGWWPVPGSYFLLEPALFCSMAMLCLLMLTVSEVRVDRTQLVCLWCVYCLGNSFRCT